MHHQAAPYRLPHRHYRWELLALLFCAFFFHQGDRAIFGVVLTLIKDDLQLTDPQLGMIASALFFTLALLMPLTGIVGDTFSRKRIITISLLFWSVATTITGAARGVFDLILFRSVATAGGEAFYAPAAYPLLAAFHQKTRALAMSIHQSAVYLGVIAAGFLGGYIGQHWGWRSAFYLFGSGGVVLGVILIFRLQDAPPDPAQAGQAAPARVGPLEALGVLFRTPTALLLTVGFTAIVFVNNAYVSWAPRFVGQKFDLDASDAGGFSMLYHHVAAMVGVLLGGRVSDVMVVSRRRFRLELQAAAMLLGAPVIAFMGLADSLTGTYVGMAAMGLFRGLYESNTHPALFDVIAPRVRASAVAVMVMIAFLAGSASPSLLGFCPGLFGEKHGLSYGFAALSVAYVIGGLAVLAALKFTFHRDYYQEAPEADAPSAESNPS